MGPRQWSRVYLALARRSLRAGPAPQLVAFTRYAYLHGYAGKRAKRPRGVLGGGHAEDAGRSDAAEDRVGPAARRALGQQARRARGRAARGGVPASGQAPAGPPGPHQARRNPRLLPDRERPYPTAGHRGPVQRRPRARRPARPSRAAASPGGAGMSSDAYHGHDHHRHDGHEHRHGRGVAGLLRAAFAPHSHDAAESADQALTSSDSGMRCLVVSLTLLAVTAVIQMVIVIFSGSVALLGDTIHNFADALTAVPLGVAFWLQRKPPTRRVTYRSRL